jgi:hypothetical protein
MFAIILFFPFVNVFVCKLLSELTINDRNCTGLPKKVTKSSIIPADAGIQAFVEDGYPHSWV